MNIQNEIYEVQNDASLSNEEKKVSLTILKAELKRQNYDSKIASMRSEIEALRNSAISLATPYLKLEDENKQRIAYSVIQILGFGNHGMFDINTVTETLQYDSNGLNGDIDIVLDEKLFEELDKGSKLQNDYYKNINNKYYFISDDLSPIIDSKLSDVLIEDGSEFKSSEEIDQNYAKIDAIVSGLDVSSKYKGILRDMLLDAKKYGINCGSNFNFSPIDVEQILNNGNNIKM